MYVHMYAMHVRMMHVCLYVCLYVHVCVSARACRLYTSANSEVATCQKPAIASESTRGHAKRVIVIKKLLDGESKCLHVRTYMYMHIQDSYVCVWM